MARLFASQLVGGLEFNEDTLSERTNSLLVMIWRSPHFSKNTHPPSLKEHKHDPKRSLLHGPPHISPTETRSWSIFCPLWKLGPCWPCNFRIAKVERELKQVHLWFWRFVSLRERAKQKHWHFVVYRRISHLTRCMTSKGHHILSEILVLSPQMGCIRVRTVLIGGHRLRSLVSLQCKNSACHQQRLLWTSSGWSSWTLSMVHLASLSQWNLSLGRCQYV